jgi:glutamate dehydrogenase (NADP+)
VEGGYRVVAVSDSSAAVYAEDGLDVAAVRKHKDETGSLEDAPRARSSTPAKLLTLDVDALAPAALEGAIDATTRTRCGPAWSSRWPTGPSPPRPTRSSTTLGVEVVPDILVNAGGVTVSWFEWVQNRQGDRWTAEDGVPPPRGADGRGDARRGRHRPGRDLPLRTAAYVHALERLTDAVDATGTVALFSGT